MIINDISCAQFRNTVLGPCCTYYADNNYTRSTEVISGETFQNRYSIRMVISSVSGKPKEEIPCFAQNNHYKEYPYKSSDTFIQHFSSKLKKYWSLFALVRMDVTVTVTVTVLNLPMY